MYQHLNFDGTALDLPTGKVVCVGLNYRAHIEEMQALLGKLTPSAEPVLFMKPAPALRSLSQPIVLPPAEFGAVHHEIELAVLLAKPLYAAEPEQVKEAIWGYGVALDLTLRDIQTQLKKQGHPWEKAKAFDGSCPLSGFVPQKQIAAVQDINLQLQVNSCLRQQGNTAQMIFPVYQLIAYMSKFFTLAAGDVILTGTPQGIGSLTKGDVVRLSFNQWSVEQSCC